MNKHVIQRYDYHNWANNRFFEHLKGLPGDVYEREIKSVFNSVSEVTAHIYQTDGMWLSVISGDSFDETYKIINSLQETSTGKTLQQMQELYDDLSKQYRTFLDTQDDLSREMEIEHPIFGKLKAPVAELVEHVVNHGTYHRGNITAMLRQQGHPGVSNDYVFYLDEVINSR